jgi:hypothetical protein
MSPKEKAKELYDLYRPKFFGNTAYKSLSKQCALIAVDEIEDAIDFDWMQVQNLESQHRYWQQVKEEIEKL